MNCECGGTLEYLGDEDEGSPVFKCTTCNERFDGEVSKHEHMVARAKLIRGDEMKECESCSTRNRCDPKSRHIERMNKRRAGLKLCPSWKRGGD